MRASVCVCNDINWLWTKNHQYYCILRLIFIKKRFSDFAVGSATTLSLSLSLNFNSVFFLFLVFKKGHSLHVVQNKFFHRVLMKITGASQQFGVENVVHSFNTNEKTLFFFNLSVRFHIYYLKFHIRNEKSFMTFFSACIKHIWKMHCNLNELKSFGVHWFPNFWTLVKNGDTSDLVEPYFIAMQFKKLIDSDWFKIALYSTNRL